MMRFFVVFFALFATASVANAQPRYSNEHVTEVPEWRGHTLAVPCPPEIHQRNAAGTNGAGLCVIASVVTALRQQGRHAEAEKLWEEAKKRPGGYHPEKLTRLLDEVLPGVKYASVTGRDPAVISRALDAGYLACNTMTTGEQYGNAPIHHMVNTALREPGGYSCFVDNNDPKRYHFLETRLYDNRFVDGSEGWMMIVGYPTILRAASWGGVFGCLMLAMGLAILNLRRRLAPLAVVIAVPLLGCGSARSEQMIVDVRGVKDNPVVSTPKPAPLTNKFGELSVASPPAYATIEGAEVLPFGRVSSTKGTGLPPWCAGFWVYRTASNKVIAGGWVDGHAVWVSPREGLFAQLVLDPRLSPPLNSRIYNGGLDKIGLDRTPVGIVTNDPALGALLVPPKRGADGPVVEQEDHVCTEQCPNRPDCPKRPRPSPSPGPDLPARPDPPAFNLQTAITVFAVVAVVVMAGWVLITRVWPFLNARGSP